MKRTLFKNHIKGLALFTLFLPTLALAVANPPPPGPAVPLAPTGLLEDRQCDFSWSEVANATWCQVWISRNGNFYAKSWIEGSTSWQPADTLIPGNYDWWVQTWGPGGLGPWSEKGSFQIEANVPGPATLIEPSGLSTNRQATFQWEPVEHATWYQLWISLDGSTYTSLWVNEATEWTPSNNLPFGNYSWWVRTWGPDGMGPWSNAKTFKIGASSPIAPSGLIANRQPQFQWTAVVDATWYQIWVGHNGAEYTSLWINGATAWNPAENLPLGEYAWYVRAWGPGGMGPWSEGENFSIEPILPGASSPIAPTDVTLGPDAGDRRPLFSWTTASHAAWYRVHLYRNGSLYGHYWVEDATTWLPDSALPGGDYTWKVEAWSEDGYGPLSESLAFSVVASQFQDLEDRAHLLVNNYRATYSLPSLSWNETIAEVCREHSQNMADGAVPFGHEGFQARVNEIGLTISWVGAAENVAWNMGFEQPADTAVTGWINSPGHQANMVSTFTLTGIGVARTEGGSYYFTQIFVNE